MADAECDALAAGSYCVAFDADATITYCLEGCQTGTAGEPKCHERPDFACSLLGLIPASPSCTSSDDCPQGQLCATAEDPPVCGDIVTGCVPNCGGDFDCEVGDFCDFSTGLCVSSDPGGQAIGTLCDPNAATDPCSGFCIPTTTAGDEGICSAFCTVGPSFVGCGWDGVSVAPDAACLFGTRLSTDLGIGDVGICGALCDCNDDCVAADDYCVDESGGNIDTIWGRQGYCRPLVTGETEQDTFTTCP
jgi:hypothetical protein